ncbi:MAG TPA: hypothetical protein VG274_02055, partial [Rhizomicrobium sp.]|nr:hypothetical protein [Rhizomicrobium sp.]
MKLTCYSVFLFRDGWQQQQGGSWQSRDEAIKVVASECEADLEVFEIRETKVLIGLGRRPYHNPRGGYKHRYSSDEKDEPNTLFIDAVETEEIRRLCRDGEASYREDQAEIKKRIAKSRKLE